MRRLLPWLVLVMDFCPKTCRDLGYEFYTHDSYGCICAEHVDSLRMISNFTLRYSSPRNNRKIKRTIARSRNTTSRPTRTRRFEW